METFIFIFDVAKAILAEVIAKLVTGKTKAALKAEISIEVAHQLLKIQENHQEDINLLKYQVMGEIETLSSRDPNLLVSPEAIKLKKPFRKPLSTNPRDKRINNELRIHLTQLDKIVAQGREELGLPTKAENSLEITQSPIKWKVVSKKEDEMNWDWAQEIAAMEEEIRHAVLGEVAQGCLYNTYMQEPTILYSFLNN